MIPRTVKIAPFKFSVQLFKPTKQNEIGNVSFNECEINIANTCNQVKRDTLLHECMHMLLFINGRVDLADDENFVSSFSSRILHFIKENPTLIKYLIGEK